VFGGGSDREVGTLGGAFFDARVDDDTRSHERNGVARRHKE